MNSPTETLKLLEQSTECYKQGYIQTYKVAAAHAATLNEVVPKIVHEKHAPVPNRGNHKKIYIYRKALLSASLVICLKRLCTQTVGMRENAKTRVMSGGMGEM